MMNKCNTKITLIIVKHLRKLIKCFRKFLSSHLLFRAFLSDVWKTGDAINAAVNEDEMYQLIATRLNRLS